MIWRIMGIEGDHQEVRTMGHLHTLRKAIQEVVVVGVATMMEMGTVIEGRQGIDTRVVRDTFLENIVDTKMIIMRMGIMIEGMVEVIEGRGEVTDTVKRIEVPS